MENKIFLDFYEFFKKTFKNIEYIFDANSCVIKFILKKIEDILPNNRKKHKSYRNI